MAARSAWTGRTAKLDTLPFLVDHPIQSDADGMRLIVPGRAPIPLISGADPVRGFNPGWRAEVLFTLLDPAWLLVLRHDDGSVACWHVERSGLLCLPPQSRPEPERLLLAGRLQGIGLWLRHAPGRRIRVTVPDAVRAYLALPTAAQRELDALLGADPLVPVLPDPALLRRSLEDPPPPLLVAAVPDTSGSLVGNPGAMMPLVAGEALAELLPGWRIASVEAAFTPLLAVILRHRDGQEATWFVDLDGRLVSHATSLLPAHWQRHLARRVGPLLSALWSSLALGVPDVRLPEDEVARLPSADLVELVPFHLEEAGHPGDTRVWTLDAPPPPGTAFVVPTAQGLLALDAEAVARALRHSLHAEMDRLLREQRMVWPSPADGTPVESDGFAFLLDQNCFAYRFRHEAIGLVFHVVCTGTYFYNHALYFPTADLLAARTPDLAAACGHYGRARAALLGHLLAHRDVLGAGAGLPRDPAVQHFFGSCAIHIGHYVWQDLAGLAFLLRHAGGHGRLPQLQMFSSDVIQAYFGPEERIFPALDGRITRHTHGFDAHIPAFYRSNQRVIRYNAISIPRELGPAVVAAGNAAPSLRDDRLAADAARAAGPVILFGIRAGSRTLDDAADFAADLLRHLRRSLPGCTVVVDGLNDQHDRGGAVRDDTDPGGELGQEFALAAAIAAAGREAGVPVVDIVNRSGLCSVVWCSRADCFIAPLGAALSKYRWICNTPGLVLSSRWNLQHRADLHIYDAPAALEGSSEMLFNGIDEVRDCTPERDAGGFDGRGNFVVSRPAIFERLVGLVRRHAGARSGGP